MTSAQVVETSVKVTTNSPSQDYTHPDDHNLRTYDMTPGFKPFTIMLEIHVTCCLLWLFLFIEEAKEEKSALASGDLTEENKEVLKKSLRSSFK